MPLPKAQMKAFLDELSKLGDKPVAKALNKLIFQASDEEVAMEHPELMPQQPISPAGAQPQPNAVANSQTANPSHGPGGV